MTPKLTSQVLGTALQMLVLLLNISAEGEILDVLPQYIKQQRRNKTVELPQPMKVPLQPKRSGSNPPAYFLCDNSKFVLGLSEPDEKEQKKSLQRFENFRELHRNLLCYIDNDQARALLAFLEHHTPKLVRDHLAIINHTGALLKGKNLVFMFKGAYIHDNPAIQQVWEDSLASPDTEQMQCLITGQMRPIARLHENVKIRGGKSTGSSLVSFNKSAYESYNRSQGQNSPVGIKPAFSYTTALDYLLSDANPNKKFYLGDTTVVYWAESENRAYETAFASIFDPTFEAEQDNQEERRKAENALHAAAEKIKRAQMLDLEALLADLEDENPRFYILGLAPNAARVSVRFFITDPFYKVVANIMAHYHDLAIVKQYDYQTSYLTVKSILDETVSKKSSNRDAAPLLAGTVFRSVLTNTPYPAALFNAIINRIRADMDNHEKGKNKIEKINYARAAVIKAFLIRKYRHYATNPFKEVLTMALNEQSTIPAYLLGRLFAVLEKAQQEAVPDAKATIKDRYFTSACASPASVFPVLLRLSQHHITKASNNPRSFNFDRRIQEIIDLLDVEQNPIPARLTLDEQGIFVLGYYHQRANFYEKKNNLPDKSDETNETEN